MKYKITAPKGKITGEIRLDGSKSISNRALILNAISGGKISLTGLSTSDDTRALQAALNNSGEILDIGAAGTSMRFLTAYLACQENSRKLITGTHRMRHRPIGVLVDALRKLGAKIRYAQRENCPPLYVEGQKLTGGKITMPASTSSQFISALLLVGCSFEKGLEIELEGKIVSRPYIQMTVDLLKSVGIPADFEGNKLSVHRHTIEETEFKVEADWSAASYYFSIAALSEEAEIKLLGLQENSWQGDSVVTEIGKKIGVEPSWENDTLILRKNRSAEADFNYDFLNCPDLAQTIAVAVAGLNLQCQFTGLETLAHKETDRIVALKNELGKAEVKMETGSDYCHINSGVNSDSQIEIETYEDHRMAMAFAPLSLSLPDVVIDDPMVVTKSYHNYYHDLKKLGFTVEEV